MKDILFMFCLIGASLYVFSYVLHGFSASHLLRNYTYMVAWGIGIIEFLDMFFSLFINFKRLFIESFSSKND